MHVSETPNQVNHPATPVACRLLLHNMHDDKLYQCTNATSIEQVCLGQPADISLNLLCAACRDLRLSLYQSLKP